MASTPDVKRPRPISRIAWKAARSITFPWPTGPVRNPFVEADEARKAEHARR